MTATKHSLCPRSAAPPGQELGKCDSVFGAEIMRQGQPDGL